jgi:murein DD-endopeptidase MepM/ murein hydrolase activator NlpD
LQRALVAERAALAEQRARAEAAETDAAEQRRQVEARQAERDALAEQLGEREVELARLTEGFDALKGRVGEMEALARKVRQTLGLPAATGPAGGDATDGEGAALLERLAALDARSAVAGQALAVAERALRERLAVLRQVTAAGQKVWLSPAVAAVAPAGWPAAGSVSSTFGPRVSPIDEQIRFHPGVDIVVNVGTPVRATQAGQVISAGDGGDLGLAVVIHHAGDFTTVYGHNSQVLVRPGQQIERGQVVARSGNTGSSTGPHLHYEVRYSGRAIDPAPFLKAGK